MDIPDDMSTEEFFATLDDEKFIQFLDEVYIQPYYADKFLGAIGRAIVMTEIRKRMGV